MDKQQKLGLIKQIKEHLKFKIENFIKTNHLINNPKIILIGDSMIEYLDISKYLFNHQSILNHGISGLTSKELYNNLDSILNDLKISQIFLSIGANDKIVDNIEIDNTLYYIELILKELNNKYPNINKTFISLTPIIAKDNKLYNTPYLFGRIKEEIIYLNKKIKAISNLNNFNYINVYDSLLDKNKNLNINYTTDGIHLNDQGYQIYSKMINKNIKRR